MRNANDMIPRPSTVEELTAADESSRARGSRASGWVRFLSPSLTDVFFLALLFWLFASDPSGWDRLLWDGDTALHTRTGDFILDHGYVPTTDPFSFTKPGERWYAFQWLDRKSVV